MIRLLALLAVLLAGTAVAEERAIVGLSQHQVSLTTSFSGSELFVYGAIRRESPLPKGSRLDIIVAVTGPSKPVTLHRKQREFGIWVNGPPVVVDEAPSFYAVATTRPLHDAVSWTEDFRYKIGLDYVVRLIDAPRWVENREDFRNAVVRLKSAQGLYSLRTGTVRLTEETLFETRIRLPANLVEGDYRARIFLMRDRQVIDVFEDEITVRRAGIGRAIYTLAQKNGALYGILSIIGALLAGWLASAFFRAFLPN